MDIEADLLVIGGGMAGLVAGTVAAESGLNTILVRKGQKVSEGQPLFVVEAMKMENQVNSPASGSVKAVNGAAGDQVDTISPIIELEL